MPKSKTQIIEPIDDCLENVVQKITKSQSGILNATHEGKLFLDGIELNVAVLQDGTRIIKQAAVFKAFGRTKRGRMKDDIRVPNRPAFLDAKNIQPFIHQDLEEVLNIIDYKAINGSMQQGYDASILPKMCKVYLDTREAGKLVTQQASLARASEILLVALANVGITALVDEATGYQLNRKHDALRVLLNQYIAEGMQKWIKTFPDAFFEQLDKLYNNQKTISQKRPQYYGRFINSHIYEPIEHGYVKQELNKLNITEQGKRKGRFHQWLNDNGKNILIMQIGKVQGVMELFDDIESFKKAIKKQKTISVAPYLFDEMNNIVE
jgi:hypothetical protein